MGISKGFVCWGNEEGMFIMVNPELKEWFPKGDKVFQSDFIIRGDYNFKFSQGAFARNQLNLSKKLQLMKHP